MNVCKLCDGTSALPLNETYKGIDIVVCQECGFVWNRNMAQEPEQVEFYTKHNRAQGRITRRYLVSMLARAGSIVEFLDDDIKAGMKHLDVGCAEGTLLALSRVRGLQVQGLEIDVNHSRFAREVRGLPVLPMTLEAAPLEPGSFDLVSFVHVIEHLVDPVQVLGAAHNLLGDEGLLYMEVPNLNQPLPGLRHFFRPKHNFYFTSNSLRSLAYKAGFVPLRVGYSSRDASIQLLCRKGTSSQGASLASFSWRDDARTIQAKVRRERRRFYLLLNILFTNYLGRQKAKVKILRRYGHVLPEIHLQR